MDQLLAAVVYGVCTGLLGFVLGSRLGSRLVWWLDRIAYLPGVKRPYSNAEIARADCFRCGSPAEHQWQVCADGNTWRPLCAACDVDLNRRTLEWMGHPEADQLMVAYVVREA